MLSPKSFKNLACFGLYQHLSPQTQPQKGQNPCFACISELDIFVYYTLFCIVCYSDYLACYSDYLSVTVITLFVTVITSLCGWMTQKLLIL